MVKNIRGICEWMIKILGEKSPDKVAEASNEEVEARQRRKDLEERLKQKVKRTKQKKRDITSKIIHYANQQYLKKARELVDAIEEHIGYDEETGLVKYEVGGDGLYTHSNALLAIAKLGLGKKGEAWELVRAIEKYIGYDEKGLIRKGVGSSGLYTYTNASLAIAFLALAGAYDGWLIKKK
jgi:hypothetical protein